MTFLRFLAPTLLGLAASGAAGAEPEYSTKETRAVVYAYAACVVAQAPLKASAALLADIDNGTMLRRYPQIVNHGCLGKQSHADELTARFSGDQYRYALADALVRREFAKAGPTDFGSVPRLTHREPGPRPEPVKPNGKKLRQSDYEAALKYYDNSVAGHYLSKYGECVVRMDAGGARSLLLAVPDTPAEAAAFGPLRESFASCLAPGETLRFSKAALRGAIALNYYRLAHAVRQNSKAAG
jgi:hypothetical protein